MSKKLKRWSKEEINFLEENWSIKTHKEIAIELNRSIGSVEYKIKKMRLVNNDDKWTKEEIDFLKENWFKDKDFLVAKLNRSYKSISSKRFRLGLTNPSKWSKGEEQFLLDNWNKEDDFLVKNLNRNIGAIRHKGYKMGLNLGKFWTKEDDEYLRNKWGTVKIESICKYLNRSKPAVEHRAYAILGLGTQLAWYSLSEVADMIQVSSNSIKRRIIKSNFPHHRSKTKQRVYMLDEEQLRRFLKQNQDLWHYDNLTINIFENNTKWLKEKAERDRTITKKYKKNWSEEEDFMMLDMLKNNYTYDDIALRLNRTIEGVKSRHRYKYRCRY